MLITNLDADCMSILLPFLEEKGVINIAKTHHRFIEYTESYWKRKREFDVKNSLLHQFGTKICAYIQLCINLRKIKLGATAIRTNFDKIIDCIADNCLLLEVLDLQEIILTDETLITLTRFCTLKKIYLKFKADDDVLEYIFGRNVCLEHVYLNDVSGQMVGHCFESLPDSITAIELFGTTSLKYDFLRDELSRWNLKKFVADKISRKFLPSLTAAAPNLEELTCNNCISIDSVGTLKYLKRLKVNRATDIDDNVLKIISTNCSLLEALHLHPLSSINTTEGLSHLVNLKKLTELSLEGRNHKPVWFGGKMGVLSGCKRLQTLKVMDCLFTNEAAIEIIRECQDLTMVDIFGCDVTTDLVMEAIEVLDKQKDRTSVLKLKLVYCETGMHSEEVITNATHPLLQQCVTSRAGC